MQATLSRIKVKIVECASRVVVFAAHQGTFTFQSASYRQNKTLSKTCRQHENRYPMWGNILGYILFLPLNAIALSHSLAAVLKQN